MFEDRTLAEKYPRLDKYTAPVKVPERDIIGRDTEIRRILAAFHRPELSNVMLIGDPGSGKTALVQGTMMKDKSRIYMEVDLARMIADVSDANDVAAELKLLFDETAAFGKDEGKELVLFIDEFHQIVQIAPSAVEVLKPLLADSGTRGIRVVAATTYVEFREYISPNQPLVERLQRINLTQPNKELTIDILRGMAKRYGVDNQFPNDYLFEMIYEYTNRYIPANSQPRKSIIVLDSMVGWYRAEGRKMDMKLLADVIYESEGVNVAFRVDATTIKQELDKHVLSQEFATRVIEERLQICVADLNNKSKPMSSFLFTGSTGVGKAIVDTERIPVYTPDGSVCYKLNGELRVGDYVFNREGKPVAITGVYPQGKLDVYEVELTDGRKILCNGEHLWTYKSRFGNGAKVWKTTTTEKLMEKYSNKYFNTGRSAHNIKFVIPMNQAVQYSERQYDLHPYVMGRESYGKFIPEIYKYGSIEQRWKLIQGLFDMDGHIDGSDTRYNVSYSTFSEQLVLDIQEVLYSLGISSFISNRSGRYHLHVKCNSEDKTKFFTLPRKFEIAKQAILADANKTRIKKFGDVIGIRDIRKLNYQADMTCIMVDDAEHLYQAGQYIVTHNTEMTKQLARILFEDDRNLIRFDMTEFANQDSLERFRTELTARVWERPYSIILLDEIEKACAPVTRILLQVLDDGRLMDENNREISFSNAYVIMTTNAGSEIYQTIAQYGVDDTGSGKSMKKYNKLIRESISSTSGDNKFPPELLGRIDTIVPFQPLSEATMKKIVEMKLKKLKDEVLKKHNVDLRIQSKVVRYLVEDNLDTDSNSGGARIVMSKLETEVTTAVARFINANPNVSVVGVMVEGELAADHKTKLESEAFIKVVRTR